jgi:hypothetical protein
VRCRKTLPSGSALYPWTGVAALFLGAWALSPSSKQASKQQLYGPQRGTPFRAPWLGVQHAVSARVQGGSSTRARARRNVFFRRAALSNVGA